ncbi:SDR family oxidoreductase [Paenibacillus sp. R14(2021)]|uniref:SDR family oxidoreductase n=1 Tax=Paenibacillus sp. R14(2021) TaxID=2859228 RepID=UPI001C613762|nr:NAD(P)H-binding protein [Paenibacillus sp. R14(2021)]
MKIVVIGGTGMIGTKLGKKLIDLGHEVVAASPSKGVNTITGEGLAEALKGAQVVVDVSNSPSWEDAAVLEFFETSTRNLLAAEAAAGVGHHVALSVVGTDGLLFSGYFRAKMAQENLITSSNVPYTIVRATQFFEFASGLTAIFAEDDIVRTPNASIQAIAGDDVAAALVDFAVGAPLNGLIDIAGPERISLKEFVTQSMRSTQDNRQVVADDKVTYYCAPVTELSLVPQSSNPRITSTRFEDWLKRQA